MKKIFSLLLIAAFTTGSLVAQEAAPAPAAGGPQAPSEDEKYLLMKFGKLHDHNTEVNFSEDLTKVANDEAKPDDASKEAGKNLAGYELPDYHDLPGQLYTKADLEAMAINLKLHNWEVHLTESSARLKTEELSLTRAVTSKERGTVLGVRVHFPGSALSGAASIVPPFSIPVDYGRKVNDSLTDSRNAEEGLGILHNTGSIKSLSIDVYGRNFEHGLTVVLEHSDGRVQEVFMGSLNFRGWRTLKWENPNYIRDVRDRNMAQRPLYPNEIPFVRLAGLKIHRNSTTPGGDFVGYFDTIYMVHDLDLTFKGGNEQDIVDEDFWYVVRAAEIDRKYSELRQLADKRYKFAMRNFELIPSQINPRRNGEEANPNTAANDLSYNPLNNGRTVAPNNARDGGMNAKPEDNGTSNTPATKVTGIEPDTGTGTKNPGDPAGKAGLVPQTDGAAAPAPAAAQ